MKLSLNWLSDYIDQIDKKMPPDMLAEGLTMAGLAVDAIMYEKEKYRGIVVGEIKTLIPHPHADRLELAEVFDGKKEHKIVCGAKNIAVGQKVPLALPGAILKGGRVIRETMIRDIVSEGMICSSDELDIGEDASNILILEQDEDPGNLLADVLNLNDVVFDISITPNRSDCFSHQGIAREVAAIFDVAIKEEKTKIDLELLKEKNKKMDISVNDQKKCSKYCALFIENIEMKESPQWLKRRLMAVGIRPINSVVDITNFVMMEIGTPIHAFDADKLCRQNGKVKLGVRFAKKDEIIVTLDGKKRTLTPDVLTITSGEHPVALAGIMGGKSTEVSDKTTSIVLEAAVFDPSTIRTGYRKLGLRTEASIRFEKGIDWFSPERALAKAAYCIQEINHGVLSAFQTISNVSPQKQEFPVSIHYINGLLGTQFSFKEIEQYVHKVGIETQKQNDETMSVCIPPWRHDISLPADIAEEVGRLYNYNNISSCPMRGDISPPLKSKNREMKSRVKHILQSFGYHEIYTYSFYGRKEASCTKDIPHSTVYNPLNAEQQFLRASLLPAIISKSSINLRFFDDAALFEIGTVFLKNTKEVLPFEDTRIAFSLAQRGNDTFHLYRIMRGHIEELCDILNLCQPTFKTNGNEIDILFNNHKAGSFILLDKIQKELFKVRQDMVVCECSLKALLNLESSDRGAYKPIPLYPSVVRDYSFIVPPGFSFGTLDKEIHAYSALIENVEFVDEYVKDAKRSLTVRVMYRSDSRTLTTEEIEKLEKGIVESLKKQYQIVLR